MDGHAPDELAENHKRIWLAPRCQVDERSWCEDSQPCDECGLDAIEYIRADLAKSEIERLLAALRNADTAFQLIERWCGEGMITGQRARVLNMLGNAPHQIRALLIEALGHEQKAPAP